MAYSQKLVKQLCEAIQWIAPVTVYTGEDELQALAEGAIRVLCGEEQARELEGEAQG
jgi:butyrate kinase